MRETIMRTVPVLVMGCVLVRGVLSDAQQVPEPARVIAEIRAEAIKGNDDPQGRPLPLAANWNVSNWSPMYQVELIKAGHHLMPWVGHPNDRADVNDDLMAKFDAGETVAAMRIFAEWKLPVTLRDHNYAMPLLAREYVELPESQNPLTLKPDGTVWKRPSPFGAVEPWAKIGHAKTHNPMMKRLEEIHPDPPLVMFLSNNETRLLRWHELNESKRFLEKYGPDTPNDTRRELVAQGWIKRFNVMLDAMREGLDNATWRERAIFVGYDAFGPIHYGRWDGWNEYAMATADRISPYPLYWDGGSPSYYDNNWQPYLKDYTLSSVQTEAMNWVFMLDEAYKLNPDFWFEISVWDGDKRWWTPRIPEDQTEAKDSKPKQYIELGQEIPPTRYEGWVQYGLWLLRPRVAREFRGSAQPRERYQQRWDALLRTVDRVWAHETLRRFWRKGELVPNRARQHPYQSDMIAKYENKDRWFRLDTSLDPAGEWEKETILLVWPLARVLGEKGQREWLLYAFAPLGDESKVSITIPDFGPVTVNVRQSGSFYLVKEVDGSVTAVAE